MIVNKRMIFELPRSTQIWIIVFHKIYGSAMDQIDYSRGFIVDRLIIVATLGVDHLTGSNRLN